MGSGSRVQRVELSSHEFFVRGLQVSRMGPTGGFQDFEKRVDKLFSRAFAFVGLELCRGWGCPKKAG